MELDGHIGGWTGICGRVDWYIVHPEVSEPTVRLSFAIFCVQTCFAF